MFFGRFRLFLRMLITLLKTKLNSRLSENCKNENAKSTPVPINDYSFSLLCWSIPEIFE
jgi:hypothetical protein